MREPQRIPRMGHTRGDASRHWIPWHPASRAPSVTRGIDPFLAAGMKVDHAYLRPTTLPVCCGAPAAFVGACLLAVSQSCLHSSCLCCTSCMNRTPCLLVRIHATMYLVLHMTQRRCFRRYVRCSHAQL